MYKNRKEIIYKQFPMRIEESLALELDEMCKATKMNKTTFSRVALQKLIKELHESGAAQSIASVCAV